MGNKLNIAGERYGKLVALGAMKQFWYYGDMLDCVKSIYDF